MSERALEFALSVVGGPYDGAPGLVFVQYPDSLPLPEAIAVDRCPGDGRCRMSGRQCRPGHVAYWIPSAEPAPVTAIAYALEDESIETDGVNGSARYVMGELLTWGRGEAVEFAGAGAMFDEYERWRDMTTVPTFGTVVYDDRDGRTVRVRLWEEG